PEAPPGLDRGRRAAGAPARRGRDPGGADRAAARQPGGLLAGAAVGRRAGGLELLRRRAPRGPGLPRPPPARPGAAHVGPVASPARGVILSGPEGVSMVEYRGQRGRCVMSRSAWRWLAALTFLAAPVWAAGEEPEPVGKQQEKQFEKEITVKVKLDYLLYL